MRYWAYLNNEVLGPFEKDKLKELANFSLSSLICPEGGQAEGWKEASTFSEVRDALAPAPARQAPPPMTPQRMAEESPLAMTMRGTLIEMPSAAAQPKPAGAAAPASAPPHKAEDAPLAMTMRGTLIESSQPPAQASPAASAFARAVEHAALEKPKESTSPAFSVKTPASDNAPSRQELESQVAQLKQKIEQMSALLTSMGDSQFQLLNRLSRVESAITEIKALLLPPAPKKD